MTYFVSSSLHLGLLSPVRRPTPPARTSNGNLHNTQLPGGLPGGRAGREAPRREEKEPPASHTSDPGEAATGAQSDPRQATGDFPEDGLVLALTTEPTAQFTSEELSGKETGVVTTAAQWRVHTMTHPPRSVCWDKSRFAQIDSLPTGFIYHFSTRKFSKRFTKKMKN